MNRFPILPALIAVALANGPGRAAQKVAVQLGDITISYDPARWRDAREMKDPPFFNLDRMKGQSLRYFFCIAPECRGDPFVWASLQPRTDVDEDKPRTDSDAWHTGIRPLAGLPPAGKDFGGLTSAGRIKLSGCRARTPIERSASGTSGEFLYAFGSGANLGCSGTEGVPAEMFLELLDGISLGKGEKQ